jgi:hypothetical protein
MQEVDNAGRVEDERVNAAAEPVAPVQEQGKIKRRRVQETEAGNFRTEDEAETPHDQEFSAVTESAGRSVALAGHTEAAAEPGVPDGKGEKPADRLPEEVVTSVFPGGFANHGRDAHGNPSGGWSRGIGIDIKWQDGPLGRGAERKEPNGAFVETVIRAVMDRLNFYQNSRFVCVENATAINHLTLALAALERRTRGRELREVEGTYVV